MDRSLGRTKKTGELVAGHAGHLTERTRNDEPVTIGDGLSGRRRHSTAGDM